MDMAPLWVALAQVTKRSICFSDPTQLLFLLCNDAHHSSSCKNQQWVLYSLLMDPTTSDMSVTFEFVSTFQFRRDAQTSEMMPTTAGGAR